MFEYTGTYKLMRCINITYTRLVYITPYISLYYLHLTHIYASLVYTPYILPVYVGPEAESVPRMRLPADLATGDD